MHFTVCICLSMATDNEILQVKGSCTGIHDSGCRLNWRFRASSSEYDEVSQITNIKKIYSTSKLFFMDIGKTLTLLMLVGAGVIEILVHSYCLLSQVDCESRMLNFKVHMESSVFTLSGIHHYTFVDSHSSVLNEWHQLIFSSLRVSNVQLHVVHLLISAQNSHVIHRKDCHI
jgi:hypothetical protein